MNTCLRNRALLLLSAGEGTSEQQAHLATCTVCAARYRQFVGELESIERILRTPPPPAAPFFRRLTLRGPWLPAVALAVTVALVWGGVWLRQLSRPIVAEETSHDVVSFLADQVSPALFATADVRLAEVPTPVANLTYLQAALDEGWPCEQQEPFPTTRCDMHPFPLLLGED